MVQARQKQLFCISICILSTIRNTAGFNQQRYFRSRQQIRQVVEVKIAGRLQEVEREKSAEQVVKGRQRRKSRRFSERKIDPSKEPTLKEATRRQMKQRKSNWRFLRRRHARGGTAVDAESSSSIEDIHEAKEGKRVTFQASKSSERSLLDVSSDRRKQELFRRYMTLPPEHYSLLSSTSSISSRRWVVRRLTSEESLSYREQAELSFALFDEASKNAGDYFRLAIPLQPLVGIDLTPVVDVAVVSPASSSTSAASNEEILIRSLRVSLLSTKEEVNEAMGSESTDGIKDTHQLKAQQSRRSLNNENITEMGNEAIGAIGKLEEVLKPRLSFVSTIFWSTGDHDGRFGAAKLLSNENACLRVQSRVTASLTIPPELPVSVPRVVVSKFGSLATNRVLAIALPQFLRQLELDFERWASIEADDRNEEIYP